MPVNVGSNGDSEDPGISEYDGGGHMNQHDHNHDQRKWKMGHMPVFKEILH
jgi:hypothetical protein